MRRREFLLFGFAAAAWPFAVPAQQAATGKRTIGAMMLFSESNPDSRKEKSAFEQSLQQHGWTVGQNLEIDYLWGIADAQAASRAAAELLSRKPDLLFANSVAATRAAKQATGTIPIVFNAVSEPVGLGFVASLSHPGGNITGFAHFEPSIAGKWIELLKAVAPHRTRVGVMFNQSSTAIAPQFVAAAAAAASRFGLTVLPTPIRKAPDIDSAMQELANQSACLMTLPDTFLGLHAKRIEKSELQLRIPGIHPFRYFVDAGSLMYYGLDLVDQFRQAAIYIDRIFRGARPGDLPVQQPTKFEFVINVRTAKALDLTVPPKLLALADEVIE